MSEPVDSSDKKSGKPLQLSRRNFLAGSSSAMAASALLAGAPKTLAADQQEAGPDVTEIRLTVNAEEQRVRVEDRTTLVEVLRDQLGLTGTKIGCDRSECGACTVLLDGRPVYACSQLAVWLDGRSIQTVEGLAQGDNLSPVQQAFVEHNGPQCGFCTPGQLMSATALLAATPRPSHDQVKAALVGNLCRCSNYNAIVEAVVAAGNAAAQEETA